MKECYRYVLNDAELDNVLNARMIFNIDTEIVQSSELSVSVVDDMNIPIASELKIFYSLDSKETLLGTFLVTKPSTLRKSYCNEVNLKCHSTLWLLLRMKTEKRYTCKKGTQVTNEIMRIIMSLELPYGLVIDMSTKCTTIDMDFEIGTPWLSVINELLKVINYTPLYPTREGDYATRAYVNPVDRKIDIVYDELDKENIILPLLNIQHDFYDIPNVYIFYTETPHGQVVATYENKNPLSITSIANAPRNPIAVEVRDVSDKSTLYDLAKRECVKQTSSYYVGRFEAAINPTHWYNDTIALRLNGIDEVVESVSWSLRCKPGANMEHVVRKVVSV